MKKLLLIPFIFSAGLASAQVKTARLYLFDNGVFFHRQEGSLPVKNGEARLELPLNLYDETYWLSAGKDNRIKSVHFLPDTIKVPGRLEDLGTLLKAHVGKRMTLQLFNTLPEAEKPERLTGTLESIQASGFLRFKLEKSDSKEPSPGETVFLSLGDVQRVFLIDAVANSFAYDSIVNRAVVRLEKKASSTPLSVVSLQQGIRWTPSYLLKLNSETEGTLSMKATVENSALSLDQATVDFVVGSPRLMLGALNQNYDRPVPRPRVVRAKYGVAMGVTPEMAMGASMDQAQVEEAANFDVPQTEAVTSEGGDLYFYTAENLSLRKDHKAFVNLFTMPVSIRHVYEVSINDFQYVYTRVVQSENEASYPVYHSLKLKNKTGNALAPASVFVLDDKEFPLAQDRMDYVAKNGEGTVRLSQAKQVVVKNQENEISREDNARKTGKLVFTKVTLKGQVTLTNDEDKPVSLKVNKTVIGEVREKEADGVSLRKRGQLINYHNPTTELQWQVNLAANETKRLNYTYDVYLQTY